MEQHVGLVETVEIFEGHDHYVAARDCHLFVVKDQNKQKDKAKAITWVNNTNTPYRLDFKKSPFEGPSPITITVPAWSRKEGTGKTDVYWLKPDLKLNPGVLQEYFYDVVPAVASSAMAADPVVIVHVE